MTQKNKAERIVIQSKAFGAKWEQVFFEDIEKAFLDGYRIAKTSLRGDASMRNFRGRIGRAVMYLEGSEPEAWKPVEVKKEELVKDKEEDNSEVENTTLDDKDSENEPENEPEKELSTGVVENSPIESEKVEDKATPLEEVEGLSKYKELKAFAEKHKIELPAKTTNPKAVKKIIKTALES